MLKTKYQNVMGKATFDQSYWMSWVERSMECIVTSMMSKYGIGQPYVQMRNAMLMDAFVTRDWNFIKVRTSDMGFGDCSSA